jgi:hypothetical protein
MAAPYDANAVTIYGKFSQFELLSSGSSQPEASASVLRMFASGNGKLYYMPAGASGSAAKEIATSAGGLDFDLTAGDAISSFTYNGSAAASVSVNITGETALVTVADADTILIDDGDSGAIKKITRANYLGSALASLDAGIDVNGANFTVSTAGVVLAASGGFGAVGATTVDATGLASLDGGLDVNGNMTVSTAGAIAGATSIDASGDLTVGTITMAEFTVAANGNTDVDGTLNVEGIPTFQAGAVFSGGVTTANAIAGATTISGSGKFSGFDLDMESDANIGGDLTVQGNLVVEGTRTLLDTTDLQIEDNLIELNRGSGASGTARTNLNAGLFISGSNADRSIVLAGASDGGRLKVSGSSAVGAGFDIVTGGDYAINGTSVLTATTLGSAVVNSSLTSVGTLATVTVAGLSSLNGSVDLGDATADTITATGRFDSDLVPSTDSARDLGTSALQWAELHVDTGNIDQLGSALDANAQNITNVGTFEVDGAATFNGAVTLGDASSDVVTVTGQLSASYDAQFADDKVLYFGSDNDGGIKYDEAASNKLIISGSAGGLGIAGTIDPLYDSTYDIGVSARKYKNLYLDAFGADWTNAGNTVADMGVVTTMDLNGGSIDGTIIGAAAVAAGSFAALVGTSANFSTTLNADGATTLNGAVTLGDAVGDDLTFTGRVASDFAPKTDSAYDLGTSALQFATAYVDEVESATGGLALTTAGGIAITGTANASGYLLELPTTGDARARAWVTYSSARHKTNVKTLIDPVATLKQLRGVTYDWKGTGQADVGFIAEEVGAIVPEVVSFGHDGRAEGIDYGRLTSVLVEAMKQQQEEIEKLQSVMKNLTSEQPSLLEDK